MTDKEYYDYICSLYVKPEDKLTEREWKQFEKIVRKIETKLRDSASKGKTYFIVNFTIMEFLDSLTESEPTMFVNSKWRELLHDTLYKRLKNGGFRVYERQYLDCDIIKWEIKEKKDG